ncbi:MAG: DUF4384 domain-containing protein [Pseudomonadota bacterium]
MARDTTAVKRIAFWIGLSLILAGKAVAFDAERASRLLGADLTSGEVMREWPRTDLARAYIPDAIDLSALMPPPVWQKHGSCVAFSVAYAVRGYYAALERGAKPGDDRSTPSPAYVHSKIRVRDGACEDKGSHAVRALRFLQQSGTPSRAEIPDSAMCEPAVEAASIATSEFSIIGGERLYERTEAQRAVSRADLDKIKLKLAAGHPVMVGFPVFRAEGVSADSPVVTLSLLEADQVYRGSLGRHAGPAGGHAFVFVGYDERRQAFLAQNSWGDTWSGNGFGWISYEATLADLHYAYVMTTAMAPPVPRPGLTPRAPESLVGAETCASLYVKGMRLVPGKGQQQVVGGFVPTEGARRRLAEKLGAETIQDVAVRPWPVCEALLTLDEPLADPQRPTIRMFAGRSEFAFGDFMGFRVTTPEFPSYLYLVYLQSDGSVVNLLPRQGAVRRLRPPNTVLTFGDGRAGRQTFEAGPPVGSEAIVALAARSPIAELEALERPGDGQFRMTGASLESGADDRLYLSILRTGLASTPDPSTLGRVVSADVAFIRIRETR